MRPPGSPGELERRRRRAIAWRREGHPPVEVAGRVGLDRRSVRRWNAAYRQKGERALAAKAACGRPPKLTAQDKVRLERRLFRGARAAGFPTDLWTCPRVRELMRSPWGVRYHVDYIAPLLRSLGWTPQKPERRASERDEEASQRWVKQQWPARTGPWNDCANLPTLVEAARQVAPIGQVLADAEFDSERNHTYVRTQLRARNIIPAKRGKKTWRIHGVRAEMRRAFPRRQYARRALIETVFSTIKRKLSARAPGRSLFMQLRQALLLGLAYNLYRL